ncbi:MAG TPA: phytanoyl-CoA dioxygenase family protein [Chloroflexota bacterium]|nr:phytanoyl-CoA dioxygenase family protein [Chloroflexota bacterium]
MATTEAKTGKQMMAAEAPEASMTARPPAGAGGRRNGALGVTAPPGPAQPGMGVAAVGPGAGEPVAQEWLRPEQIATDFSPQRERYRVSVSEYVRFHEQGFLVVKGLLNGNEVEELRRHASDLMYGRVDVPGLEPPTPGMSVEEIERRYLRIHMLHRHLEIEERYLLHPRVLDVLEALIGPDVMAMQTMYFIKAPGGAGQGYHQDSYYIPTYPDSLCGAWIAADRADEENGCVWFTTGSQHEPIYPTEERVGQNHRNLADLTVVRNVSDTDTEANTLSRIAAKYRGREVPAIAEPGDVVFFAGHILHRSHTNRSPNRFRRALVCHYANARSFTMWGERGAKGPTNHLHILARGWTHLGFGLPRFGTPCAANQPRESGVHGGEPMPMAMMADGDDMQASPQDEARNDPTMMRSHEADAVHV